MTAHRPRGRGSPGETLDRAADPAEPGHKHGDTGDGKDHGEHYDDRAAETAPDEGSQRHAATHDEDLDHETVTRQHPQVVDKERIPLDHSLIVAHGGRSLAMTCMVLLCTLASLALSPQLDQRWVWIAWAWAGYAGFAALSFLCTRTAARERAVPLGTRGDSRVVVALVGAVILAMIPDHRDPAAPPDIEALAAADAIDAMHDWGVATVAEALAVGLAPAPFACLFIASILCGMADGAWIAMAMRHMQISFFQALRVFLRAVRSPGATTWQIVRGRP